jgi:Tol biopolymer transport system component
MNLYGKIAFASGWSTDFDIWSIDLNSGSLNQLTIGEHWNDFPQWSPDGKKIAFLSIREDGISSVYTMDANGDKQQALTKNIYCRFPSWSPDGKQILFTANANNPNEIDLFTINADGSGSPQKIFSGAGQETEPSWSPDGNKIIFASPEYVDKNGLSARNTDIFEYEVNTKKLIKLTSHPAKDYCPRYSPDGKKIAFVSHRNALTDKKYLEQMTKIQSAVQANDISTINDSIRNLIALEQDADIWIMNSDGSDLHPLTDNKRIDVGIAWSPCSKYIIHTAASKNNSASERMRVIEVATGKSTPLDYDRSPLENEIGISNVLNASFLTKLIPDIIERRFIDFSFWGEERHPSWTR